MHADHLLGREGAPRRARIGADLPGLMQPHDFRNRSSACGAPHEGLNDRRDWGRWDFGCSRAFQPRDDCTGPPTECSRREEVSQRQTSRAENGQNFQCPPHAYWAQFNPADTLRLGATSQRDSSRHKLFIEHVRQRRPLSSHPTSLQASLRVCAGEVIERGRR